MASDVIRFWWVSQNKTYRDERQGGYLWAPLQNESGQTFFHWSNVARVSPGDLILSYFRQAIVAVSAATSPPYHAVIPREWEAVHSWLRDGWKVDVDYTDLADPTPIAELREALQPLLPERYGPLTASGTGFLR